MKTCTKCGETKPTTEYFKDASKRDGLHSSCKSCFKKSSSKEVKSAWYAANVEKRKADYAIWYAANRSKRKESSAAYYASNRDKVNATTAKWRAANPNRFKETYAAWSAANPEKRRVNEHNRRARKRENGGRLSSGITQRLLKLQRGKCACCAKPLGDDYHLDHIMPLALGGANTDNNMQLLRADCNRAKWAKHPVDYMRSKGFLI